MTAKVLIVDDEPNIVEVIRLYLDHAGMDSVILYKGAEAEATVRAEAPDIAVLDVMLPDLSGFELCKRIREMEYPFSETPIILLTAKDQSIDKLRGFNLGVDDYMVKPFDPNELVARIKAIMRRARQNGQTDTPAKEAPRKRTLNVGSLSIDLEQYKVTVQGAKADLTPKEIELLYYLACSPGRVFTREDLLGSVWNFDFAGGTRTVDAHVKNLRKKLGSQKDWTIQTLWGIGYSFEDNRHA